jgi:hypothetical protein
MFPIVGLLEKNRRRGKEEENDRANNIEIHHKCVETRHNETH